MQFSRTDTECFDSVVAGLYCAAAGSRPWSEPLDLMRKHLSAWAIHLMGVDPIRGVVEFSHVLGEISPEANLDLVRHYHRIDPRAAMLLPLEAGQWANCHDHFDEGFVAGNPFYQDFLIPYGGRYCSGAKVHHDANSLVLFGVHRGLGSQPLNGDEIALAKRYLVHLQTAMALRRADHRLEQQAVVGKALLDRMQQPLLLVDGHLRMRGGNAAGEALLRRDDRIRTEAGKLVCARASSNTALAMALAKLHEGNQPGGSNPGAPVRTQAVRLDDKTGSRSPLLLLLSPLLPDETMGVFGPDHLTMVLVHEAGKAQPVDAFVLAAIYDLTPAEAKVAIAIATGLTVQEVSASHRVAVSTVRAQLSAVFAKLGVSRQAELAAVVGGIPQLTRPMGG